MGIRGRMITLLCAAFLGIGTAAYAVSLATSAARAEQGIYAAEAENRQLEDKDKPAAEEVYAEEMTAEVKYSYVLRLHNGNVAVFYGEDQKQPIFETEIAMSGLRQTDAEKLKKGITADSYEEVLRLLEDFNS